MVFDSIENVNSFFLRKICLSKSINGIRCIPSENVTFVNDEDFKSDFKVTRLNDVSIYFSDSGVSVNIPSSDGLGNYVSVCYVSENSVIFCCSIDDIDVLELEDFVQSIRSKVKFVADKLSITDYSISIDFINIYCKDSDFEAVQNKRLLNDKLIEEGIYNV